MQQSSASSAAASSAPATSPTPQSPAFLRLMPAIQRDAQFAFRRLTPGDREEAVQEVVANAFVAYARLVELGRADRAFAAPLARFALAQVRAGRQVGTRLNSRDLLSRDAQRKQGHRVVSLSTVDPVDGAWQEMVIEDRTSTPADVAAARIDIATWLASLPRRPRQIAETLATGEATSAVAKLFRLSAARISQLRRELEAAWAEFQGEVAEIPA